MNNLGFLINFFIRILSGEPFRKATSEEKKTCALALNTVALMTLCWPFFNIILDTGSGLKLWFAVMAVLLPSVVVSFWLIERLSVKFVSVLSLSVLLIAILFTILDIFSIYSGFTCVNAVIGLSLYFSICSIACIYSRRQSSQSEQAAPAETPPLAETFADERTKIIEEIKERLKQYPQLAWKTEGRGISVARPNDDGFSVWLEVNKASFTVGFDGWHDEFEDENEALNVFAFGLSDECRLKVVKRGSTEVKWILESKDGQDWREDSTTGLIFVAFWKKKTIEYRQNRIIRYSEHTHTADARSGALDDSR